MLRRLATIASRSLSMYLAPFVAPTRRTFEPLSVRPDASGRQRAAVRMREILAVVLVPLLAAPATAGAQQIPEQTLPPSWARCSRLRSRRTIADDTTGKLLANMLTVSGAARLSERSTIVLPER